MTYPQNEPPPQPQYAQQVPPPAPQKKKRKWPWIVGAIVVVLIIISLASGGEDESATSANSSSSSATEDQNAAQPAAENTQKAASKVAGLNAAVRDGKFEFIVTGVEKGLETVGDNPYLTEKAQGQFVIVSATVNNTSDKPKDFSPSSQKLIDTRGRTFEPSTSAQIALGGSDIAVWDNINPGNTVQVKIVYDMPKDAVPASLELHDSVFSDGVTVKLG
ncbi:MAG: DUF4352 domain-containing protein [Gordonia sp. (in: high G+C Gram-positive bacteria)]